MTPGNTFSLVACWVSGRSDTADRLIIEAVVKLAKGLGTLVVAEFVGDLETRQELLTMWVTLGQGAFLGPSRDVHDIPALQP